jgi:hypothetical protein
MPNDDHLTDHALLLDHDIRPAGRLANPNLELSNSFLIVFLYFSNKDL